MGESMNESPLERAAQALNRIHDFWTMDQAPSMVRIVVESLLDDEEMLAQTLASAMAPALHRSRHEFPNSTDWRIGFVDRLARRDIAALRRYWLGSEEQ